MHFLAAYARTAFTGCSYCVSWASACDAIPCCYPCFRAACLAWGALAPSWLRIHVVLTHPLDVPRYVSPPSTGLHARAPNLGTGRHHHRILTQERSYRLERGSVRYRMEGASHFYGTHISVLALR